MLLNIFITIKASFRDGQWVEGSQLGWLRFSTFKSETRVLRQKKVGFPPWVVGVEEELKYIGVLLKRREQQSRRLIGG